MIVDSFKFLPRTFRPLYEGRGTFPGEEAPVWAPFQKRPAESRIALLSSAGIFLKASQPSFDLEREQTRPEWGDPTWRPIPAEAKAGDLGVAHLHINDEDLLADPEIALPMHLGRCRCERPTEPGNPKSRAPSSGSCSRRERAALSCSSVRA